MHLVCFPIIDPHLNAIPGLSALDCVTACLALADETMVRFSEFQPSKAYFVLNCLICVRRRLELHQVVFDIEPKAKHLWELLRRFSQKLLFVRSTPACLLNLFGCTRLLSAVAQWTLRWTSRLTTSSATSPKRTANDCANFVYGLFCSKIGHLQRPKKLKEASVQHCVSGRSSCSRFKKKRIRFSAHRSRQHSFRRLEISAAPT